MKFDSGEFYEKLSSHLSFPSDQAVLTTTLHEDFLAQYVTYIHIYIHTYTLGKMHI
jgi:hypothetical protein